MVNNPHTKALYDMLVLPHGKAQAPNVSRASCRQRRLPFVLSGPYLCRRQRSNHLSVNHALLIGAQAFEYSAVPWDLSAHAHNQTFASSLHIDCICPQDPMCCISTALKQSLECSRLLSVLIMGLEQRAFLQDFTTCFESSAATDKW